MISSKNYAELIQNYENKNVRNIRQGKIQHRQCEGLELVTFKRTTVRSDLSCLSIGMIWCTEPGLTEVMFIPNTAESF